MKMNMTMTMKMNMKQIGSILWRALKVMPVIGDLFVLAAAPIVFRRKGYLMGSLELILDILPVICLIKAAIEVYRGDIIPDKADLFEIESQPTNAAMPLAA